MATAQQLQSALKSRDIPIDVIPDNRPGGASYGQELVNQQAPGTYKYGAGPSTYSNIAPGTKTLGYKAQQLNEDQFEESKRAQEFAEKLSLAKLYSSGSGGGGGVKAKEPTAAERLEAYRKGYVDFASKQLRVIPYNSTAADYKGIDGPEAAFKATQELMNQQLAETGLKSSDYNDILKQVAVAVGYEAPDKKTTTGGADMQALLEKLATQQ